jgi:hypothetical protein
MMDNSVPIPPARTHADELHDAVRVIVDACKEIPAVRAIYTSGSYARGTSDAFSDVDVHCMVDDDRFMEFAAARRRALGRFRPITLLIPMLSGRTVAALYDNGLRVDLHAASPRWPAPWEQFAVLYDPESLLEGTQPAPASFSSATAAQAFHQICLALHGINAAYHRGDLLHAMHLAGGRLLSNTARLYRGSTEPERALVGSKGFYPRLSPTEQTRFATILERLRPSTLQQGVEGLIELAKEGLARLDPAVTAGLNTHFLDQMHTRVRAWKPRPGAGA